MGSNASEAKELNMKMKLLLGGHAVA